MARIYHSMSPKPLFNRAASLGMEKKTPAKPQPKGETKESDKK